MRNLVITISFIFAFFLASLSVEAREIGLKDIEPLVKNFLVKHYTLLYKGDIQVQCGRIPSVPIKVPEGNVEIKVTSLLRDAFVQRTVVRVRIFVDGKPKRSMGVPVQLALYDDVWVATQPIHRDDAISTINVECMRRDISKLAVTAARVNVSDLTNTRVKKSFRTGDILDHRFIEKEPVVIRNSLVAIIFKSKTISVSIPGEAMENGQIGDCIRVRSPEFRKQYRAKIIDRGTVLVNI